MTESIAYHQRVWTASRDRAHSLFAQTMYYVAVTAGLFALGAWLGHDLAGGVGIVAFIAAFACLIGMQFAVRPVDATRRDLTAVARASLWVLVVLILAERR